MERIMLSVFACIGFIYIGFVCSQEQYSLTVNPKNALAEKGQDYDVTCNCGAVETKFYMSNQIIFLHKMDDGTEIVLTNNGYLTTSTSPHDYIVHMSENPLGGWTVTLTIKDVDDVDVGEYVCKVQSVRGIVLRSDSMELNILYPITELSLKVGSERITQTSTKSVEYIEGDYDVTCESASSNPPAVLVIYIGETKQQMGDSIPIRDDTFNQRRFKTSVRQNLYLSEQHHGQHIKCIAWIPDSGLDTREAGFNLEIIPLTPFIECENNSASLGDIRSVMRCNITAKTNITCSNTMWENGNKPGIFYFPDKRAADENEARCRPINSTTIQSDLILNSVDKNTFKTTYFLTFVYHEGKHRHPVYLKEKAGTASSLRPMALLIVLLTVIASYINRK